MTEPSGQGCWLSGKRCCRKWSAPAGRFPAGAGDREAFGKRTCKPNSVVCGHSSRRRVAADTHQRPTRRFRHCMEQPERALRYAKNRLSASGRCAAPHGSLRTLPSLFGLAPCGVYLAPGVTAGAVRSYRTISPLPRRWSFRNGERTRQAGQLGYCGSRVALWPFPKKRGGVAEAVSFLWHWPSAGFEAHVPDVIRHTALRSSDFPPPGWLRLRESSRQRPPGPPARV